MRLVVVDTNVPIAANGDSAVSLDCSERCIDAIVLVTSGKARIAVDDGGRIVEEYGHKLAAAQQGVGHEFLKWVYNNQWDEAHCAQVPITPEAGSADDCDFVEFPASEALRTFDRSDRMFVAVAAAHADRPSILEAADAKWVGWAEALAAAGITVDFVCEHEIREKYEEKFAPVASATKKRRGSGG